MVCQEHAELSDGGVLVDELSGDRDRLTVLALRLRRFARFRQQDAEVVVAARQAAAEDGDGGIVIGQFLLDRQHLAVLASASVIRPVRHSRMPRPLRMSARCCGIR